MHPIVGFPLAFLPFPPTPDPIGIGVFIVSSILSVFGLFRGGGLRDVMNALNGLRAEFAGVADKLMRFTWQAARFAGKIIEAIHTFWTKVFQPLLDHIARIARRINGILDRVLKPYLETLKRIREAIDLIYNTIFRPVIQMIETVRKILAIGRILRIGAARRLDDRLLRLEGKLLAPIAKLYRRVRDIGGWMNVLVDARAVLQQAILLASIYENRHPVAHILANAPAAVRDPAEQARLEELRASTGSGVAESEFREYLVGFTGPMAEGEQEALEELRAAFESQLV